LPLDLERLCAAYYTGNCHKWLCAPKGAGFLYVRRQKQQEIQPAVISHGYNTPRPGSSRFQDAFDWAGTDDPTPWLCVGEAIRFLGTLVDGGISGLIRRNRELALRVRGMLHDSLQLEPTCCEEMVGSLAAVQLPDDPALCPALDPIASHEHRAIVPVHPLQTALLHKFGVQVPVYYWPSAPQKLLRISAQAYNDLGQYERLIAALGKLS